jgi:hypothetical protein
MEITSFLFMRCRFVHIPQPSHLPPRSMTRKQSLRRKQNEIMGGKFRAAWGKAAGRVIGLQ